MHTHWYKLIMSTSLRVLVCASVLCMFSFNAYADQNDPELDDIFERLQNTKDQDEAYRLEERIWNIWFQHDDPQVYNLMMTGVQQMNINARSAALSTFTRLINMAPDYAEAWNRRATLHYIMGNNEASKADIEEVLSLEPYHFGALSGLGLVYIEEKEYFLARNAFNSALEVHPNMQAVKNNLQMLDQILKNGAI